jgi:hypothetical protein
MRVAAAAACCAVFLIALSRTAAWSSDISTRPYYNSRTHLFLSVSYGSSSSKSLSDSFSSSTVANDDDDDDDTIFKRQCQALCDARNLPLERVKNARDLHSAVTVRSSGVLWMPHRVFRMGRLGDATDQDIQLLLQKMEQTGGGGGGMELKTLVDLRSPTELKADAGLMRDEVFMNFTNVVWKEGVRRRDSGCWLELDAGEGPVKIMSSFWTQRRKQQQQRRRRRSTAKDVLDAAMKDNVEQMEQALLAADMDDDDDDEDCAPCEATDLDSGYYTGQRRERLFISLMNEFKYVKGTVSKLRKRDLTRAILKSPGALLSRRVRHAVKKPFLDEINDGGLPMLNELLLRFGAPGIRQVLTLVADPNRHPIAFYCAAGKDRTGMITAIILALCGVSEEDIVEDYMLSANVYAEMNDHSAMVGALSQRNLDPKTFLSAPPGVMRDTLRAIEQEYGSIAGYCDWIGFGPEQQEQLRKACLAGGDR